MRIRRGRVEGLLAVSLMAACGGKSASTPAEHGDVAAVSGSASAGSGAGTMTSSGGAHSEPREPSQGGRVGAEGGEGSVAGASSAVAGSSSMSGAGSGGEAPSGAGGESGNAGCIDTCQRHGAACCMPGGDCVSPTASCRIDVLKATIPVPSDYSDLEQTVGDVSPEVLLSLTDADFAAVQVDRWPGARIALHLTKRASEAALSIASDYLQNPFAVSCNGERLFVGVTYYYAGAAAIETPVMHVIRRETGDLTLWLGAWQGAWAGAATPSSAAEAQARLDRPELRAALCRSGPLSELP